MLVTVKVGATTYQGWSVDDLRLAGVSDAVITAGISEWKWANIRSDRDLRLTASDWTQVGDAPLSAEQKAEAVAYRQALRDITNQVDPDAVTWPAQPAFLK